MSIRLPPTSRFKTETKSHCLLVTKVTTVITQYVPLHVRPPPISLFFPMGSLSSVRTVAPSQCLIHRRRPINVKTVSEVTMDTAQGR